MLAKWLEGNIRPDTEHTADVRHYISKWIAARRDGEVEPEASEEIRDLIDRVFRVGCNLESPRFRRATHLGISDFQIWRNALLLTVTYDDPRDAFTLLGRRGLGVEHVFKSLADRRYRVLLNLVSGRAPRKVDIFCASQGFLEAPSIDKIVWTRRGLPLAVSDYGSRSFAEQIIPILEKRGLATLSDKPEAFAAGWRPALDYAGYLNTRVGPSFMEKFNHFLSIPFHEESSGPAWLRKLELIRLLRERDDPEPVEQVALTEYPGYLRRLAVSGVGLFLISVISAIALLLPSGISGEWTILPLVGVTVAFLVLFIVAGLAKVFKSTHSG